MSLRTTLLTLLSLTFCFFSIHTVSAGTLTKPLNNLGLVGYWSFEGTQDTSVDDYSGMGNTGTMTNMDAGTDYVTGYKSTSTGLDFDGGNDYLQLAQNYFDFGTGPYSINLWVKTNDMDAYLFERSYWNQGFALRISSGGLIRLSEISRTELYSHVDSVTTVNDDQWHMITAVRGGVDNYAIYIDGQLNSVSSHTIRNINLDEGYSPQIGRRQADNSGFFSGSLDDIRIYSRALSASEISLLYNQTKTTYKALDNTGLVGYWSFEDATGTTATDFSGNGNTGTLTNMDSTTDWVVGKRGTGLDFDGVNDYVSVGDNNLPQGSADRTISFWINYDSIINNWGGLFWYG